MFLHLYIGTISLKWTSTIMDVHLKYILSVVLNIVYVSRSKSRFASAPSN